MPYTVNTMGFLNWINSHAGLFTVSTLFLTYIYRSSKKAKNWITTVDMGMVSLSNELTLLKEAISNNNDKLDRIEKLVTNASRN